MPTRPVPRAAALVALFPLALLLASCGGGHDPPLAVASPEPSAGTLKEVAVLRRAELDVAAAGRG
jgi:hypothetical protein